MIVNLSQDGFGIKVLLQEPRPSGLVGLHRSTKVLDIHLICVNQVGAVTAGNEQVPGRSADDVAHCPEEDP